MKNNLITKILFALILILTLGLRVYKLDQVPVSLNWDEIDAAYNAYTISNWGRDEWGKFLPLVFTSFRDDKHPIHIYITAPFVKLFGLSDFTARLPSAIIGILSVAIIFFLGRILFKSDLVGLFSALFLAVSPYHLHFSRGLWEVNFALFFFMVGLLAFFLALQKKAWLINVSSFSFGLSLLSYHSSKIVVPLIVLLLLFLYFKDLKKLSKNFYTGLLIFAIFIGLLFIDPRLLGIARVKQTQFSKDMVEKTQMFKKTKNHILGQGEIVLNQYFTHFNSQYLFMSGDQNPRNSTKVYGEFYKIDALFIFIGLVYLLKLRSKISVLLFAWLFLSPIPSSLVSNAPNATRALFMMGSIHIIAALGASKIIGWTKGRMKLVVLIVVLILLGTQVFNFLNYYFNVYSKKDPHDWQYGMKQVVEYVKLNDENYDQVFMTDIRSQPYIFFLYYLKYPLPDYLESVIYNNRDNKSFSNVAYFGKYYFGGWDPIESIPTHRVLYIVTPSQYDGLRYKVSFDVKKIIAYPEGGKAFILISAK